MNNRRALAVGLILGIAGALAPAGAGAAVGTVSFEGTPQLSDAEPVPVEGISWGVARPREILNKGELDHLSFTMHASEALPRLAYLTATAYRRIPHVQIDVDSSPTGIGVRYCARDSLIERLRVRHTGGPGEDGVSVQLSSHQVSVQTTLSVGGIAIATLDTRRGQRNRFGVGSTACYEAP